MGLDTPTRDPDNTHGLILRMVVAAVLLAHTVILVWSASRQSFTNDEIGHLAAGVDHITSGRFELFCVNPPLVRCIAAAPVVLTARPLKLHTPGPSLGSRGEFPAGGELVGHWGNRAFVFLTMARWACIPICLFGGLVCWRWARALYGQKSALISLVLWCFCPNVLGHGQLITPDVAAASLGAFAAFAFWRWLVLESRFCAIAAGCGLGGALLTKSTWIVLLALWPLLWVSRSVAEGRWRPRNVMGLAVILSLGVAILNAGYVFDGTACRLGDFQFLSSALSGEENVVGAPPRAGNRFANSLLGRLPVPFPRWYIQGIDLQKAGFERGGWSYLNGEWRQKGWYEYYVLAALMKVPVGTLALAALAATTAVRRQKPLVSRFDEAFLLVVPSVVFAMVSLENGFNRHLRYALPCIPFVFVWIGRVVHLPGCLRPGCRIRTWPSGLPVFKTVVNASPSLATGAILASLTITVTSSVWCLPHSLSYFNEIVGGPLNGPYRLAGSNIDWGQDLLFLKRWHDMRSDALPLFVALDLTEVDPRFAGIDALPVPSADYLRQDHEGASTALAPGFYAISTNLLFDQTGRYSYLRSRAPDDFAGYSIWIFHIGSADHDSAGDLP